MATIQKTLKSTDTGSSQLSVVSCSMFIYFISKFRQNRRHLLAKNVKFDMSKVGILV